jgi:hypothetical protein
VRARRQAAEKVWDVFPGSAGHQPGPQVARSAALLKHAQGGVDEPLYPAGRRFCWTVERTVRARGRRVAHQAAARGSANIFAALRD